MCSTVCLPYLPPQFGRNHYTVLRPFKEVLKLYDGLAAPYSGFCKSSLFAQSRSRLFLLLTPFFLVDPLTVSPISSCGLCPLSPSIFLNHIDCLSGHCVLHSLLLTHLSCLYLLPFLSPAQQLPERPDKKSPTKKQRQQIEEVLRCIAGNPGLRSSAVVVDFLMPDDAFGRGPDDSEVVSLHIECLHVHL